jgi:hypothetical protein
MEDKMKNVRFGLLVLWMLQCSVAFSSAEVSIGIGIGVPNLSIGINFSSLPELVPVPDYPVYYAPQVNANFFFYDGMYWVLRGNNWYASSWYNGPWGLVDPSAVPAYILRVPVRYYRQPPPYFRGWQRNAAPHWNEHWGGGWDQHRKGWNSSNPGHAPATAPLPAYQRHYAKDRYPKVEQQHVIHDQQYRYQPHEPVVQQHYQQHIQQQGIQRGPEGHRGPESEHRGSESDHRGSEPGHR